MKVPSVQVIVPLLRGKLVPVRLLAHVPGDVDHEPVQSSDDAREGPGYPVLLLLADGPGGRGPTGTGTVWFSAASSSWRGCGPVPFSKTLRF